MYIYYYCYYGRPNTPVLTHAATVRIMFNGNRSSNKIMMVLRHSTVLTYTKLPEFKATSAKPYTKGRYYYVRRNGLAFGERVIFASPRPFGSITMTDVRVSSNNTHPTGPK